MLDPVSDDAFAGYVKRTGMATPDQIDDARKQAPLPVAEALVKMGVITALQRETVEKKLEAQREGTELGGCRLLKKIGEGGMGAVYLAEDPARKRKVAIKVLPKRHASDAEFLKRFRREAEAATRLDHPNIVQAYSAGEERGHHFYVMEYCEGESLRKRIERLKFLPAPDACALVLQMARGLKHAHDQGVIHRDVKPDNIIVTPAGVAKLLDLGLAKNLEDTKASFRTVTGAALGTPHYISPEQARGDKDVDGRSDIYSLGATFYHLITGQVPFQGSSIFEIIQKHLMEQLADPRDVRPEIPESVVQVVRKMLAKSPADRHAGCAELINDLDRILAKQAPLTAPLDASLSSVAMPRIAKAAPAAKSRTPILIGGAAAALLLAGIVAYAVWPAPPPVETARKKPDPPVVAKKDPPKVEKTEPVKEEPKPEPVKPEPAKEEPKPEAPKPEPEKPKPEPEKPKEEPKPEPARPAPEPAKPVKVAVPLAARLETAGKTLRERYKDEYARKTGSDALATARKLLALEIPEDPAANYQRLLDARDYAAAGGDAALALSAVDRLSEFFLIDALSLRTDGLAACNSRTTTEGATAIATAAFPLIDEQIQTDRYDLAVKLLKKAKEVADQLKNDEMKASHASRDKLVKLLKPEFDSISAQVKTLAEKPDDKASNSAMGRFLCLVKEDWERGLPMLAKGTDGLLRTTAEKELSGDPLAQKEIVDGWIRLADGELKSIKKENLAEHARQRFNQAEASLLPTDRTALAKKLEAVEKAVGPKTTTPKPAGGAAAPIALKDGWFNLLPIVDVARHSVNGAWQRTPEGLVSPNTGVNFGPGSSRIWIPYSLPEQYEVILYVERLQGSEDLVLGFVRNGRQFAVAIDGWGNQGGGGGAFYNDRGWTRSQTAPAHAITNNKVTRIGCFMRAGFNMTVDTKAYLGVADVSVLGIPDPVRIPGQSDGLIIGSVRSVYRVSRIEVLPISGQGKVIR